MILLTPGPCQTSQTVRLAAAVSDKNHREESFQKALVDIKARLLSVYETSKSWTACLLGGSGTMALEAMLTSCIGTGQVLVLENGYYSGKLTPILAAHGIQHQTLSFGWLNEIDLAQVQHELETHSYEAILVTHHETTTARLNPVAQVANLAKRFGVKVLVDAVSSFGADTLEFSHLYAVTASANKCLHSIPGVSFVLLSPAAKAELVPEPRTYSLDLNKYLSDSPPMTPPVPAMLALQQALVEYPGAEQRRERYWNLQGIIRKELALLGIRSIINEAETSCTLTCCNLPKGWTANDWFEVNSGAGFELYRCKGELADTAFQVANMGELTDQEVQSWLQFAQGILRHTAKKEKRPV